MEEKELKTSLKQRVVIFIIAILMLGSIIAGYAVIVMNGGITSRTSGITDSKIEEYRLAYEEKVAAFMEASQDDYNKFIQYKSAIKAYDETLANTGGIQIKDHVKGSGHTLTEGDSDYLAYYVGWCADGSVFDSSLDNSDEPTGFSKALDASLGMIEGWNTGVTGMKLGGVREITIPGEQAYGENMEICGGYNKPLKFLVMAVAKEEPLSSAAAEVDEAYMKLEYANYGIDYDAEM